MWLPSWKTHDKGMYLVLNNVEIGSMGQSTFYMNDMTSVFPAKCFPKPSLSLPKWCFPTMHPDNIPSLG